MKNSTSRMTKKIFISFLFCFISFFTKAQIVTIPDANFKAALVGNTSINTNLDAEIQVSEAIAYAGGINVENSNISDLTGIESFTSLTTLIASQNNISSVYLSANLLLQAIDLSYNQIIAIAFPSTLTLTVIRVHTNLITNIDVSYFSNLSILEVYTNQLTTLDISQNPSLTILECSENQLIALDVTQNSMLTYLSFSSNNISSIDLGNNISLTNVGFNGNQITSLDLSNNTSLTYLTCVNNPLTAINFGSINTLTFFNCFGTQLTNLDLSAQSSLDEINVNFVSSLTSLNIQNGNNSNLISFVGSNNPNLTCIQVDDIAFMNTNWASAIDATAAYSEDCSCLVNIPDANFKSALISNTNINTNNDSFIQCDEAFAYTGSISVSNLSIVDLTGIESFTSIDTLICTDN